MAGITEKPWFRKFLISHVGKPLLKEFNKASKNLKAAQDTILEKIVATSKDTVFGRDHGFDAVKTLDDYRKAVPINGFGGHRPYIDRMCKGEENVLFPGKPLFYNTTSGTTAKPKMIPVSHDYLKKAYSGINRLWLYTCLKDNPHIYDGKSLSSVSAAEEGQVEDGTPYGAISGWSLRTVPKVLQSTFSAPYSVVCIKDYLKKYYGLMRCALAENITIIISPSPSNILRFHQTISEHYSELVKDIHDGTLRKDVASEVPSPDREVLLAGFKPNPARAKVLESLMTTFGDGLRPKHYWPNVALVNCWKQGNFAQLLPKLDGFFPESTPIRAFGYQASEGRAGIVLGNDWDYSALAAHIFHFEFIEEGAGNQANPLVLQPHEVSVGKRYYILFSNGSGLYRYNINDIVEIVGFYNQIPLFKFIQKGEGVTSLTGEKLAEEQVIQAVREVKEEKSLGVEYYTMFCDERDLEYKFFVEFAAGTDDSAKQAFNESIDTKLRLLNPEYEVKRGTRRLSAPLLYDLVEHSHERLKSALIAKDMAREGQYKESYLSKKVELLPFLEEMVKND